MTVRLAPSALDDFDRLYAFLAGASPTAALRLIVTIRDAVGSLSSYPDRGRLVEAAGLRELIVPFGRAAYILRYGVIADTDDIVIVRIRHSREAR